MQNASALTKHLSKKDLVDTMDIIDTALGVGSESQFGTLLEQTFRVLPVTGADVCVSEISESNAIIRNNRKYTVNYPNDWVQFYRSEGMYRVDPVAQGLFVSPEPMIWSQARRRNRSILEKDFYGAAASFGLKDGFAFGARFDNSSHGSFFSCIGADLAKHKRHSVLLRYIVPHLHVALSRVQLGHQKLKPKLSPREIEVLTWAKYGKTNWEISVLLGVGERAIKFHIENAIRKLNVVNRTQAIAVALSSGIIKWS